MNSTQYTIIEWSIIRCNGTEWCRINQYIIDILMQRRDAAGPAQYIKDILMQPRYMESNRDSNLQ